MFMDAYFQWLREKHVAEGLALTPPTLGHALTSEPDLPGRQSPAPAREEGYRLFGKIAFSYLTVLGQTTVGRPWQLYCGLAF
jgi:hypothetical protein